MEKIYVKFAVDGRDVHQLTWFSGEVRFDKLFETLESAQEFAATIGRPAEPALARAGCGSDEHWMHFVAFAWETAARAHEILSAEWSDIDFEGRRWIVPGQKNKYGRARAIPLTSAAECALAALRDLRAAGEDRVFHTIPKKPKERLLRRKSQTLDLGHDSFSRLRQDAMAEFRLRNPELSPEMIGFILDVPPSAFSATSYQQALAAAKSRRRQTMRRLSGRGRAVGLTRKRAGD